MTFSKIQRGLQKIVSKNLVTSPKNALEVIEAFNLENVWNDFGLSKDYLNPRHFFTAAIKEENYSFCLFSSLKTIYLIKENIPPSKRTYLIDATFKIVPYGCFKQLLVIYIEYFEEVRYDQSIVYSNVNNIFLLDFSNIFRLDGQKNK